ncbi:MAG: hypothetical protein LBQ78_09300 [Tannerellaceae bacterium]|jgi:hypothetical protein|nr:hypothetical protein [Tannerellaceae bacterium]
MKTAIQRKSSYILFALLLAAGLQAQVVIGSSGDPERAALLQLKDTEATSIGGVTATTGGLLLPRVSLRNASDITVISGVTTAKEVALTGLLVYNVNTSGELDEGIYEWNGDTWNLLETVSKIAGSSAQKSVVIAANTQASTPTVSMGIFQFRINPTTSWADMRPQYKLLAAPSVNNTAFWHTVARHWDSNVAAPGSGNFNATGGFSYDAISRTFTTTNFDTWQDFHTPALPKADFGYDIWLVDHVNSHAYNIQVLRAEAGLTTPIHALLVTEY